MIYTLYHFSSRDFDRFSHDMSGLGTHFGSYDAAYERLCMLYDEEDRFSAGFKKLVDNGIKEYKVSINNPLRLPDVQMWDDIGTVQRALRSRGIRIMSHDIRKTTSWGMIRKAIEDAGYDSVVYENEIEGAEDSYIVWWNEQIRRSK